MDLEKILRNKVIPSLRRTLVSIDGCILPDTYKKMKEEIDNLEVNEQDIWICSFPKSGTTWTQEMLWMILNDLDFEKGKEQLGVRSPFLELSGIASIMPDSLEEPPLHLHDSVRYVKTLKSPSVIKTHLPLQLLPNQIKNGIKKPKIVYIAREPKDTCISYYYHTRLLDGFTGDLSEFCELFLAGKYPYLPYWNHVLPYWNMRNSSNFLFLKYEDLKRDLKMVIKTVAEFLKRPLSDDKVEVLSQHLSFKSMKNNPSLNLEKVVEFFKSHDLTYDDGHFIRTGVVGDYKNHMSPEYIGRFDKWIRENTAGNDYIV